jgi:hypothetical protein
MCALAEVVVRPEAPRMRNYYFGRYSFYRKAMAKCRTQQGTSRRADPFCLLTAILDGAMRGDPSIAPNPNEEPRIAKWTTLANIGLRIVDQAELSKAAAPTLAAAGIDKVFRFHGLCSADARLNRRSTVERL